MLKKIGLLMALLLFIMLVAPIFMPDKVHVERSRVMRSSAAAVYAVLVDFNQFRSWDPWSPIEPSAPFEVIGSGVGSSYSWRGDKSGQGKMTIMRVELDRLVEVQLNFTAPFVAEAMNHWSIDSIGNDEVNITWGFDQSLSYFNRYLGLGLDSMLGKDFELGLQRLKQKMEVPNSSTPG